MFDANPLFDYSNARDATEPLVLNLTPAQERLAKAHPGNGYWCWVAQAIRTIKGVVAAYVGATWTFVKYTDGSVLRYETHPVLRAGLRNFDYEKGWKVGFGRYVLNPPFRRKRGRKTVGTVTVKTKLNTGTITVKTKLKVKTLRGQRRTAVSPRWLQGIRRRRAA